MSNVAELMADLAQAPQFPGARCRSEWQLFDTTAAGSALPRAQVAQAQARAIAICHSCPALRACAAWVDGLDPWDRPRGVVAGRPIRKPRPMTDTSTPTTQLGAQLRLLREQHGWRQRDLAALAGTQQNRIGDWENGVHQPTLPVLQRLAAAFEMSVSELLRDIM